MKNDTPENGGRVEAIGDEAVYLRINQLQKGLLQFTDSTNAERLVREYGADIRYIAPWKKWVVWDDTHWQVDTGALLYTKQLEMVRCYPATPDSLGVLLCKTPRRKCVEFALCANSQAKKL